MPGTIVNKERFLIDIGTGYYVEKETTAAQDFFARKVTFLNTQMEKYVRILQEKSFLRESEYFHVPSGNVLPDERLFSTMSQVLLKWCR